MKTETIEARGLQPLLNVLQVVTGEGEVTREVTKSYFQAMGGWPLLEGDSWNSGGEKFEWYKLVWRFRQLGYSVDYLLGGSETSPPL